jgi:hypothetical protein
MFERAMATAANSPAGGPYFLTQLRLATCHAICARLVPTGGDPLTDPGASEVGASVFIDRFLAAFELPAAIADGPAIWLRGRYSGRDPYPDPATGRPAASSPRDQMLGKGGQAHFIPLTNRQELAWKAQLYGAGVLHQAAGRDPVIAKWASQVASGLIPGISGGGLRGLYAEGLDAFDAWSESLFHSPFSRASSVEQDVMLAAAGDVVIDNLPVTSPVAGVTPPAAAQALYPLIVAHTFQACYGLPEYRWRHSNPMWAAIGYDGDTQPLGNCIYDANLPGAGPNEGPNEGFGASGVYLPSGGYREYRPVAEPSPGSGVVDPVSAAEISRLLDRAAARRLRRGEVKR